MTKRSTLATGNIPYTPNDWNDSQAAMHRAATLEEAFHNASCLAGGWYHRAVAIDSRIAADNNEEYRLRPADERRFDDDRWTAIYEVKAVR